MTDPLVDDDETLLSRFRDWLIEVRAEAEATTGSSMPSEPESPDVGLFRLVEEFTALRQEIKLQTKSARGLQEETEALLPAFRQAIEQFRSVAPKEEQSAFTAAKPLAEALVDLDEALDRGRAVIEQGRQRIAIDAPLKFETELETLFAGQSWWRRRRVRRYHEQVRALVIGPDRESRTALFDALLEGYGLIQSRLRRALAAEQIRRIETVGRAVDPETMIVNAIVDNPDLPPGHVADEVRQGYTWRGRVLRYAEVRAVSQRQAIDPRSNGESEEEP